MSNHTSTATVYMPTTVTVRSLAHLVIKPGKASATYQERNARTASEVARVIAESGLTVGQRVTFTGHTNVAITATITGLFQNQEPGQQQAVATYRVDGADRDDMIHLSSMTLVLL